MEPLKQITLTADIKHLDLERIIIAGIGEATIDWGDGKSDTITLPDTEYIREKDKVPKSETQQHQYEEAGTYTITITGDVALLWIRDNNDTLHTLDVSHNSVLKFLYCKDSQLTSLDLSGCSALTELKCSSNQLTSLDVNGCTALTKLECDGNQLTSLDVSNNIALKDLDCRDNQLTSLDVSSNTVLTELYCFDNQLTVAALNALFGTLPNNTKEKIIYIDGNPGDDDCDHDIATDKGWDVWGYD